MRVAWRRWPRIAALLALGVALLGMALLGVRSAGGGDAALARTRRETLPSSGATPPAHGAAAASTAPKATATLTATPTATAIPGLLALAPDSPYDGYLTGIYTPPAGGAAMTFYLHVPTPLDPGRLYPLVLLLHGGGEHANPAATADQNRTLLLRQPYVAAWTAAAVQQQWPCFVVMPQLVSPNDWVNVPPSTGSYALAPDPTPELANAKGIVDALQDVYASIDTARLYITGISIGAYGVWDAIERWPRYFAAAAPLAGAGDPSHAAALANLPLWAFDGTDDSVVPVSGSRDMIQAIEAAGGHPRYTEFAGAGHAIWTLVYGAHGFLAWLFAQRNGAAATLSSVGGEYGPH